MLIGEDEQMWTDFDWYCVDSEGRIGHFASAGFKRLPPSVAQSAEDLCFLNEFFHQLSTGPGEHELDNCLSAEQRTPRYLQSFVEMADRGLYSFDIESYLKTDACYFRVAMPKIPLRFVNLPARIQEILGRTGLRERALERISTVPYSLTLLM
jgi:hypothetical protein